jgi:hypothetical protein
VIVNEISGDDAPEMAFAQNDAAIEEVTSPGHGSRLGYLVPGQVTARRYKIGAARVASCGFIGEYTGLID